MTYVELMALPELDSQLVFEMREIDGEMARVAVFPKREVLWREEDTPYGFIDSFGVAWETGYVDGVLYRRKAV